MSDVVATPEAAPLAIDPSKAATPTIPAAPAPPVGEPADKPSWLDARLERERAKVLKDLGIESLDDGKKAIAALKVKEDAEKSEATKAAELKAAFEAERAKTGELASALGAYAKSQLAGLSETQKNAVVAIAGDDAAKQLKTIEAMRSTWTVAAAPAATQAAAEAVKDTAPAPSAPKDGGVSAPLDPAAVHAELAKTNPILAARYALANGVFK